MISTLMANINYTALSATQKEDDDIVTYRNAISGLVLEDVQFGPADNTLLCNVFTGEPKYIIPASCRLRIFDTVHDLSHPPIRATKALMATKFMWHGLRKEVGNWARACITYQTSKTQRHTKAPLLSFAQINRSFNQIHVDIVGHLPPSRRATHLLTIVDRFTRWQKAIALSDTSTITCTRALIVHWISPLRGPD